jgi:hypothetical protein
LIEQWIKGYIQFAQMQTHLQVLKFLPLEKVEEHYYLPQEIEEEIILSTDSSKSIRRKLTSSSPPYSPQSAQKSETITEASNDKSFASAPSKVDSQNHQRRPTGHGKNKPLQFITSSDEPPSEKLSSPFNFETKRFKKEKGDRRHLNNIQSSNKVRSGVIVSSEGLQQPFPTNISNMKANKSKEPSDSRELNKSKLTPDDENKNSQSEQLSNITKTISERSTNNKYAASNQEGPEISTNNSSILLPNARSAIKRDSNKNSNLDSSGTHVGDNSVNPNDDKPLQIDIDQTKGVATLAGKSLNISDISQPAQDGSLELMSSKRNSTMNNATFASITPSSKTKIDDNEDDSKPYGLSKLKISDRNQKATITINKLEVHVIGDNKNNVQRSVLDRSIESAASRHGHKLDFEDHQVNTETLNKSYLWKYKVRL